MEKNPRDLKRGSTLKTRTQNKNQQIILDTINKLKQDYIDNYGIQLEMPANYVHEAFFYDGNTENTYIVAASIQVFPDNMIYYDFGKIQTNDDEPQMKELSEEDRNEINRLAINIFESKPHDKRFLKKNCRNLDSSYINCLKFSEDRTMLAIMRRLPSKLFTKVCFAIDIFDCSSIDFFLEKGPLTSKDSKLIATIEDSSLFLGLQDQIDFKLKFSNENSYLTIIKQSFKEIYVYDYSEKNLIGSNKSSLKMAKTFIASTSKDETQLELSKVETGANNKERGLIIRKPVAVVKLPYCYEGILEVTIDEFDLSNSLIAAKKQDQRDIEIFTFGCFFENENLFGTKLSNLNQETNYFQDYFPNGQLRVKEFDLQRASIMINSDHTISIFCSGDYQNEILQLAEDKQKRQHQFKVHHLSGLNSIFIKQYDEDFLLATISKNDNQVCLRHSQDSTFKIRLKTKFTENQIQIRDIQHSKNKIQVLLTRDDEEFIIEQFQLNNDKTYESIDSYSFSELYDFQFQWPYICYIKGQKSVFVQNVHNPEVMILIKQHDLKEDEIISNISLTSDKYLYIFIQSPDSYRILEKDIKVCIDYIIPGRVNKAENQYLIKSMKKYLKRKITRPQISDQVTQFSADKIRNKKISQIYVKTSASIDIYQRNEERMIFFIADVNMYCIMNKKVVLIGAASHFKQIQGHILAFRPVDERKKETNEIYYLTIGTQDYRIKKIYEERDGKLQQFLPSIDSLLVVVKQDNTDKLILKTYKTNQTYQNQLESTMFIKRKKLLYLESAQYYRNGMIPIWNDLIKIVKNGEENYVHHYKNVIYLQEGQGQEQITHSSPLLNESFRRMLYFVVNKKSQKVKKGIILPYLTDHQIIFSQREYAPQFSLFVNSDPIIMSPNSAFESRRLPQILTLDPQSSQLMQHNIKGQLQQVFNFSEIYSKYGAQALAISGNGQYFVHSPDEDYDLERLFIIRMPVQDLTSVPPSTRFATEGVPNYNSRDEKEGKGSKVFFTDDFKEEEEENSFWGIKLIESISLDLYTLNYSGKNQALDKSIQNRITLSKILSQPQNKNAEIVVKINDNLDILIGQFAIIRNSQGVRTLRQLKKLFLLKRTNDRNKRELYKIVASQDRHKLTVTDKLANQVVDGLTATLLQNKEKVVEEETLDADFLSIQDFCMTNDKIIMHSKAKLFSCNIPRGIQEDNYIEIEKSIFEIQDVEEAQIISVSSFGQSKNDFEKGNYYVFLKIQCFTGNGNLETEAIVIKYNIQKDKEFSSFDCSINAQVFFDCQGKGFILNNDSIIDIDQGIPLYFFKTGMDNVKTQSILGGDIDKGSRFCKQNKHFMIKNKVNLTYCYFIMVLLDNNRGKALRKEMYDPEAFYQLNGSTVLHAFANSYPNLKFILDEYEITNPQLLNLLLLKDNDNKNALQLALDRSNSRCVNLILQKLANISMNNIHALKDNFEQLLNYNGFEDYLRLCFFQNHQMRFKTIFNRKQEEPSNLSFISSHRTSFMDKAFYQEFADEKGIARQVIIRAFDAGWILKFENGINFQTKLSESENMNFFETDTIRLLVNFQWTFMKPKIIKFLFLPFLANMIIYNIYCVYLFNKKMKENSLFQDFSGHIIQVILLLFTFHTVYIERKQIQFHRQEYVKSFWNLLDLAAVVIAPTTVVMDIFSVQEQLIRPLMSICNLIFYLRCFYFLRIFDSSAHLIRIIIEITLSIRNFLFVFLLAITGFGASFLILADNNDASNEEAQFVKTFEGSFIYSYRMSLGDFDVDSFENQNDPFLIWVLFVLSSMFTTIILLNMLVAIMSESFSRVSEQSESQRVREYLQLIVENDFLIDRKKVYNDVKYIIEIKDDIEDRNQDQMTAQLQGFEALLDRRDDKIKRELAEVKDMLSQILNRKTQDQSIDQVKSKIMSDSFMDESNRAKSRNNNID